MTYKRAYKHIWCEICQKYYHMEIFPTKHRFVFKAVCRGCKSEKLIREEVKNEKQAG